MTHTSRRGARLRLDRIANPLGPPEWVFDAVANDDPAVEPDDALAQRLRERLGALAGVPASWIARRYAAASSSPITMRLSAPGLRMENTRIGSFWSRHSAKAVASITCRCLEMASSKLMLA